MGLIALDPKIVLSWENMIEVERERERDSLGGREPKVGEGDREREIGAEREGRLAMAATARDVAETTME